MTLLLWTLVALAAIPAVMSMWNLLLLRQPPQATGALSSDAVSVLIPARNEADNIAEALDSVIASAGEAKVEILVLDDDSTDATAAIVGAYAAADSRVRLLRGGPVASGLWGKPVACARLARAARGRVLLFMDADVRLEGDAIARIVAGLEQSGAEMLSGIPRQVTLSTSERMIVPLIHFVLVGFLPMFAMRRSASPGYAAACGQLLAVRREAYERVGGHRAVADRVHDAMALARQLRHAGYMTDLADFTKIARCRMYGTWREVIAGFAKNAHEGLGSPGGLVPWTVLLFGGQSAWLLVLPLAMSSMTGLAIVTLTALLVMGTRLRLAIRFESDLKAVWLHPFGMAALVAIQWYALLRRLFGRPVAWKSRLVSG